jgi:hypothetical protein
MDARSKLIDLAAFSIAWIAAKVSRIFVWRLSQGAGGIASRGATRAKSVLMSLSDPTTEPIAKAPGKGAVGAWPGAEH